MTAACRCCTCQGRNHPDTSWRPVGMLGPFPVETCPADGCRAFAILPVDGYDVLASLLRRLEQLGCDPQPTGGGAA